MGQNDRVCKEAIEINDCQTLPDSIRVVVTDTGKVAHLPLDTTIIPGHALVPVWLKNKLLGAPAASGNAEIAQDHEKAR